MAWKVLEPASGNSHCINNDSGLDPYLESYLPDLFAT